MSSNVNRSTEATPLIQLLPLENKTAIDISDQILKKVLGKLKIEQQLLNKLQGQELKEDSDYGNIVQAFLLRNRKPEERSQVRRRGM